MVFYADLIFLFNLLIDYLILWTSGKFLHLRMKKLRLIGGATIGAGYIFVYFIPSLTIFHILLTKILVSIFMVWTAFGFVHLVHFVRSMATFYFVSFLFGGGVFGLQYLLQIDHEILNGIYVSHLTNPYLYLLFILVGALSIWLFSTKTFHSIERKTSVTRELVDVEVIILGQSFKCKGLIDTGNQLHDPISRKPVLIIEAKELTFLPESLQQAYRDQQFELERFERVSEELDPVWLTKIHLVPFRSVAKEMQFLLSIRPDKVVIQNGQTTLETEKVLIGLDYGQLSVDHSYHAIIHPELLIAS